MSASRITAVFLDRDGVINRKAPEGEYVTSWKEFEFLPGALEGMRLLAAAGPALVVATNQRGVARRALTAGELAEIHQRMIREIRSAGGRIDAVYHCPHEGGCACRKPLTGMFESAARELGLTLSQSAVVGDRLSDMQAARAIGAVGVLVAANGDPQERAQAAPLAEFVAADLIEGARWLIARGTARSDRGTARGLRSLSPGHR